MKEISPTLKETGSIRLTSRQFRTINAPLSIFSRSLVSAKSPFKLFLITAVNLSPSQLKSEEGLRVISKLRKNEIKIICTYLGNLHTEAKHSLSGSVIHTDAPKDHDGEGKDFAPTDLLASSLGTCVITIMGIEAKRRGWYLGNIKVDVYKIMT